MAGEIQIRPLFVLSALTGAPQQLGDTPGGRRMLVPIDGGTFAGERLRGTVEPGGSDWITIRTDASHTLDARMALRTDDGALIGLRHRGLRHGPPEVMERIARGEPVDPRDYYQRTAMLFETAAKQYEWINRVVAIASGERLPEGPRYDVFEVL